MSALDLTGAYADYHVLLRWILRVSMPQVTHRLAAGGRDVHIADGDCRGSYDGRVVSSVTLDERIGDEPAPRVVLPELTFEIARTDDNRALVDAIIADIRECIGNTQYVSLYLCTGEACSADDRVFYGTVDDDGVQIDAEKITVRARCALARYDVEVPQRRYSFGRDEGDPDVIGEPIPLLYGDWTDAPSAYWLPCAIYERRTEIADGSHRIGVQLCQPGEDGVALLDGPLHWRTAGGENHGFQIWGGRYRIHDAGTTSGKITLHNSRAVDAGSQRNVWQKGDTVHLRRARGNRRDVSLLQDPVDIIHHLLTDPTGGNVASSFLGESIVPGSAQLRTGWHFRARLDQPRKLITEIIADICRDAMLVFFVKDNVFEVARNPLLDWDDDLQTGEGEAISADALSVLERQRHTIKPRAWAYNGCRINYRRNPSTGKTTAFVSAGAEPFFSFDSDWLWRDCDARAVAGCYARIFQTQVELLDAPILHAGLSAALGERVRWSGDGLDEAVYYAHGVTRDFVQGEGRVRAVRRSLRTYRAACASAFQGDYASSDEDERRTYGWYTDDQGEVDGDPGMSDLFNNFS